MGVFVPVHGIAGEGVKEPAPQPRRLDDRTEGLGADAHLGPQRQRLGVQRGIGHAQEVHQQLHLVPRPDITDARDRRGPATDHRAQPVEQRRIAAHHRVQRSRLGLFRGAAQRGVHHMRPLLRQRRRQPQGGIGVCRGGVDHDQPRPCPGQNAIRPQHHRFHLRRIRQADVDDVAARGHVGGAGGLLRAKGQQAFDRGAVAVATHPQGIPFGHQVLRHAMAHEAKADETDHGFGHGVLLTGWR